MAMIIKVGDVVEMKYGIGNCRIVAIPFPDRVDVTPVDLNKGVVGVPLDWVEKVLSNG